VEKTECGIHRLMAAWCTATKATASRKGTHFWYRATSARTA
jgi:hypothetical protein